MRLERVDIMPVRLDPGVLYASDRFEVAAHLCPCGCGSKVVTPLGPAEWTIDETPNGPTLNPSIGSWQLPCRSHYWIRAGIIEWAGSWSQEQVEAGRKQEQERRAEYYASRKQLHWWTKFWRTICSWFKH